MRRSFIRFEEALHIFCEDVRFDIDGVVDGHVMDAGVFVSEGDDGDVDDAVVPFRDGEADTVDGDRAFFRDVAAEIFGNPYGEPPALAFGRQAGDSADTVDVTLHEMAAEAGAGGERTFEIDEI